MPTGLHNTPGPFGAGILGTGAGPYTGFRPKTAVNKQVVQSLSAAGVAQPVPNMTVAPGENVFIRGAGGAALGNAALVYVGLSREDVTPYGRGYALSPDTEISYPVDHVGQIWFNASNAGRDGVTVSVRANQT